MIAMLHNSEIKRLAAEAGFDLCGVIPAEHHTQAEHRFRTWLSAGYADGLGYLHRNLDLRFDPTKLVDGARSVVVCAVNYKSTYSLSPELQDGGVGIASYALMRDYHKSIKRRLKALLRSLQSTSPTLSGRICVDSAPILEKHHAQRAGLGWIGRQSLLVTPQFGTFVLLGELIIDHDVDQYDVPIEGSEQMCGSCRRCVDVCPVQAINEDRTINTARCISARTIEFDSRDDESLSGWIFGCDICQSCCVHNQRSPLSTSQDMQPIIKPLTVQQWCDMSNDADFDEFVQGTPLKRSSLQRVKSNIFKNKQRG